MEFNTFLSSNTVKGFVSFFPSLLKGKSQYVIKGGPGTGKSTMIKNVGNYGKSQGFELEYFNCSSDPKSLDGVYIKERNCAVCDGTSPHLLEPENAGPEGGIVNLTTCWNESCLKASKDKIKLIKSEISDTYKEAYFLLEALGKLCEVDLQNALKNESKVDEKELFKFCSKTLKKKKIKTEKKVNHRFLSTFSSEGFTFLTETVNTLAKKVYSLPYDYGIGLLSVEKAAAFAEENGYETFRFHEPLFPDKTAQLYVPEAELFIVTLNPYIKKDGLETVEIRGSALTTLPEKIKETDKIEKELCQLIIKALKKAKALHDDLEKIFIKSMDFDKAGKLTADLMTKVYTD